MLFAVEFKIMGRILWVFSVVEYFAFPCVSDQKFHYFIHNIEGAVS